MKILLNILFIIIASINLSLANELKVFDFTETELSELQVRKVRGADNKTFYAVGINEGNEGGFYLRPLIGYNITGNTELNVSYVNISNDGSFSIATLGILFFGYSLIERHWKYQYAFFEYQEAFWNTK